METAPASATVATAIARVDDAGSQAPVKAGCCPSFECDHMSLDAVHLATAEQLGEPPALVTIVTRDTRVRANALALGFAVE